MYIERTGSGLLMVGRGEGSAGLSCLSPSSNHTHETDRSNQINQFPATHREMLDYKT